MSYKIKIERGWTGWTVHLQIDQQGFTLREVESRDSARWFAKQLRTAIKRLLRERREG